MKEEIRWSTSCEGEPFVWKHGDEKINETLGHHSRCGGKLTLACGCHVLSNSIRLNTSCLRLDGEVWNYSSDPNGVFESPFGSKLRLNGAGFPAILVGSDDAGAIGGVVVRDLGVQGNIAGMDTRTLYSRTIPDASAGLSFSTSRIDQCEFSKLSFCGLASAVSAWGDAELDACLFEKLNTDGCAVGVSFAPRASYYTKFRTCVIADTPYYGFFADGEGKRIMQLKLSDLCFVRNGGAFSDGDDRVPAAVYFRQISDCVISDCLVDAPGTFWYYAPDATDNSERHIFHRRTVGILVEGNKNRLVGNTVTHSEGESILIDGNENILLHNVTDGDVVIAGEGNQVSGLVFTKPESKLILVGKAAASTNVFAVPEERILRK